MCVRAVFGLSQWLRKKNSLQSVVHASALLGLSYVGIRLVTRKLRRVATIPNREARTLDVRWEGYTVKDVETLLRGYGLEGRRWYSYLEVLDLGVFMWSYAAVSSMIISALTSNTPPGLEWLKFANLLPWTAAMADAMENILILAMLKKYPDLTAPLAPYAVVASRSKWQLLFASVCAAVAGVGLYCVGVATN